MSTELARINGGVDSAEVKVLNASGAQRDAMLVENSFAAAKLNKEIQFNVSNTATTTNKLVRIGSVVSREGQPALFGLPAGAEGAAGVADDIGAKVLKLQGFGLLTTLKPVIVDRFKIQSSDSLQLNAQFRYKALNLDNTVDERAVNVLASLEKSDFRTDLNVVNGNWILDATNWLEVTSFDGKSFQMVISISGFANVSAFVPMK